jgi:hypothetical protein
MRKVERETGLTVRNTNGTNIFDMTLSQYHTPTIRIVKRDVLVRQASDDATSVFRKSKQLGTFNTERGFYIVHARYTIRTSNGLLVIGAEDFRNFL